MDEVDLGVVYEVMAKDFMKNPTGSGKVSPSDQDERILFGGPIQLDLTAHFQSLGELLFNSLRQVDPQKVALVSDPRNFSWLS